MKKIGKILTAVVAGLMLFGLMSCDQIVTFSETIDYSIHNYADVPLYVTTITEGVYTGSDMSWDSSFTRTYGSQAVDKTIEPGESLTVTISVSDERVVNENVEGGYPHCNAFQIICTYNGKAPYVYDSVLGNDGTHTVTESIIFHEEFQFTEGVDIHDSVRVDFRKSSSDGKYLISVSSSTGY